MPSTGRPRVPLAARWSLACLVASLAPGCSSTSGTPVDPSALEYVPCERTFDCGIGRYCNAEGFCWADCRSTADCSLIGEGLVCTLFGQCLPPDGGKACTAHADCGTDRYCNGRCSQSQAACGSAEDCPWHDLGGETCEGTCGARCGTDNDCLGEGEDLECTPVGLCLQPGWEKWIPPGELPPTRCNQDAQCNSLGWGWVCNCDKVADPRTGRRVCTAGGESVCVESEEPVDFGGGPDSSPAHAFRGVWGMRMVIGVVSGGLPLVGYQNTYSSNLFLVKVVHRHGDTLELTEKLCQLDLINFVDSDQSFTDMAWMVVPVGYLRALPLLQRTVTLTAGTAGSPFETTRSLEVRGCLLQDPDTDPLPDRHDYDADPNDPRIWDEDGDGNPGMTTLMDGVLRGEIYNVQRWRATYHGTILDPDHVDGPAEIANEQLVLSAGNPDLIYDTTTEIHAQADRTYFRLKRLADDASCGDLIREGARDDSWLRHTNHQGDVGAP